METNTVEFILTVPHFYCIDTQDPQGHPCDYSAGVMADALASALRSRHVMMHGPIAGTISRVTDVDLNRAESRHTAWRKSIDAKIADIIRRGNRAFVVDCHSYGSRAPWVEEAESRGNPRPTIVFLDSRKQPSESGIPEALVDRLPKYRVAKTSVGGSPQNDIVLMARHAGATWAVLLEIDEIAATSKNWIDHAASDLVDSFIRLVRDHPGRISVN